MTDWIATAERLRAVRRMSDECLVRAVIDQCIIGPMLLDRVAADVCESWGTQNQLPDHAADGFAGR